MTNARLLLIAALASATVWLSAADVNATTVAQAQLNGGPAHPGDPTLPCTRPTGTVLAHSRIDNGIHVIDLNPTVTQGAQMMLLVHPGSRGREMRLLAVDAKGKRRELGRAPLQPGAWQNFTVSLGDGPVPDHLQLSSTGLEPFWLTGAALHVGGEAQLADLSILPNPLLALSYDGSQGLTQLARTLAAAPPPGVNIRLLMPGAGTAEDKAAGARLAAAIASGWNTLPPPNPLKPNQPRRRDPALNPAPPMIVKDDSVHWYASSAAFASAVEAALAEMPQMLVINLSSIRSPTVKPDAIAKLMTQASRAGIVLALMLDERPDDAKLLREWQQWVAVMHVASPALGIFDQQEVHDWYAQPGAMPVTVNPLLGEVVDRTVTITLGFTDLRARYEWALYEARLEALPTDDRGGLRLQSR